MSAQVRSLSVKPRGYSSDFWMSFDPLRHDAQQMFSFSLIGKYDCAV